METEVRGSMCVRFNCGEAYVGRVGMLELFTPELSVSMAAGEGPRSMELKWS